MKARVEGHNTLIRDLNNNAILNVDAVSVQRAREAKRVRKNNKQELEELKHEVGELKLMMREILDRL